MSNDRSRDRRQGVLRRLASAAVLLECTLLREASAQIMERPESKEHYCPLSSCKDPLKGDGFCYEAVCPPGYYKCCATCTDSPCYGVTDMILSWRGEEECIKCPAGYYCDGCDTFEKCPPSTRPGREGPRASPAGSSRLSSCEACSVVHEASFDLSKCVPRFTTACSREYVTRCIRNCDAPDKYRRKQLTPCEMMKCQMKCAKLWSQECLDALRPICIQTTKEKLVDVSLAVSENEVEWIDDCDVDCNSASRPGSFISMLLLLLLGASGILSKGR